MKMVLFKCKWDLFVSKNMPQQMLVRERVLKPVKPSLLLQPADPAAVAVTFHTHTPNLIVISDDNGIFTASKCTHGKLKPLT